MAHTIGYFGHSVTKIGKKDGGLPFQPFVVIEMVQWGKTSADGAPIVSADLVTAAEIDFHINALKQDLDAVCARAKRALKEAQDQTKAIVAGKNSN